MPNKNKQSCPRQHGIKHQIKKLFRTAIVTLTAFTIASASLCFSTLVVYLVFSFISWTLRGIITTLPLVESVSALQR